MTDGRAVIKRALLGLLVAVLLAALVFAVWAWRNPFTLFERTTRRALTRAGLERGEVTVDGRRLVFWQGGEGPDLLLLHGAGDQAGSWARTVVELVKDHRLTVLDLPGHGDSEPSAGPLPMGAIVEGVGAFLEAGHAGASPVLVGNSLGAWVAMVQALRRPGRVSRVVAVNGGPVRGDPGEVTLVPADREAARKLMETLRDPSSPTVPANVLDDLVRRSAAGPIGRLMADLASMEAELLDGRLGEIGVPVDLLWGESDGLMTLDYARRMEAELPRARLTTIPRCGHVPQLECPERFLERLREVLVVPPPALPQGEGRADDLR